MKPIKEMLKELPEPARSRAMANCAPLMADRPIGNLPDALIVAFFWEPSPEGYAYWQGVFNDVIKYRKS